MTDSLLRRKTIVPDRQEGHGLARTLGWPHLVALGVGAIVGTGILTLIGVGAAKAGPAVLLGRDQTGGHQRVHALGDDRVTRPKARHQFLPGPGLVAIAA